MAYFHPELERVLAMEVRERIDALYGHVRTLDLGKVGAASQARESTDGDRGEPASAGARDEVAEIRLPDLLAVTRVSGLIHAVQSPARFVHDRGVRHDRPMHSENLYAAMGLGLPIRTDDGALRP